MRRRHDIYVAQGNPQFDAEIIRKGGWGLQICVMKELSDMEKDCRQQIVLDQPLVSDIILPRNKHDFGRA